MNKTDNIHYIIDQGTLRSQDRYPFCAGRHTTVRFKPVAFKTVFSLLIYLTMIYQVYVRRLIKYLPSRYLYTHQISHLNLPIFKRIGMKCLLAICTDIYLPL